MRAMALHSSLGQVQNEEWLWDLEKEGFRLDLSCDCAALQSPPYMRRDCVILQVMCW